MFSPPIVPFDTIDFTLFLLYNGYCSTYKCYLVKKEGDEENKLKFLSGMSVDARGIFL